MTLSLHRFSIRDYTSKMRSLDVFKCWPFAAAEVSRQDAESWLPPITVPKSRWCSDELAGEGGEGGTENRLDEAVSQSDDDESESTKDEEFTGVGAMEKIVTRRKKKMKKVMNKKSKVEKPASVVPLSNESKKMKKKQKTTTTLNKEFTAKKVCGFQVLLFPHEIDAEKAGIERLCHVCDLSG
ncbi:hypothetical protein RJT34_00387 [Clitoria ternatea]|uniref:Uncharacterized protein n=1 Tax=Clitoria ternatea TaxID=43366 RepID=A0AAN9KI67_CLITE